MAGNTNPSQDRSQPPAAPTDSRAERRARPRNEKAHDCPRCNSTNTKFCYYNNYSLAEPRYFCKTCRRYWTDGASLRNVPGGGGSRKNKRRPSSSAAATTAAAPPSTSTAVGSGTVHMGLTAENHDLTVAFPALRLSWGLESGGVCSPGPGRTTVPGAAADERGSVGALSALDMVRGACWYIPSSLLLGMPGESDAALLPQSMLGLSLDTHAAGTGEVISGARLQAGAQLQESAAGSGRLLFSFEDLRPIATVGAAGAAAGGGDAQSESEDKEDVNDGTTVAGGHW